MHTRPRNEAAASTEALTAEGEARQQRDGIKKAAIGKPFIPSWLDDYGLPIVQFRIYCHLCRRADNKSGVAWTAGDTMAKICQTSARTVWRSVAELERQGFIRRMGKKFGAANNYLVLVPIGANQAPIAPANCATTSPIGEPSTVPPEHQLDNSQLCHQSTTNRCSHVTSTVPPEHQKGNPKKVIHRRVSNTASPEAIQFAVWFKSSIPEAVNLAKNWQQSFAKAFDDLVRLDKRQPEEIRRVCQWARKDSFWSGNFMSPVKLRKRNGDEITYYDVFLSRMQSSKETTTKTEVKTTLRPPNIEDL